MKDLSATKPAAGPLGPNSTFGTRRRQKVGSATAIVDACLAVLGDELRPSIMNVVEAGRGFSESTLNRERYKPILKAAQRRHEAMQAGTWQDGDIDDLAEMQQMLEKGYWVRPTIEPDEVAVEHASASEPELTLSQAMAEITRLRNANSRLAGEVQRRDDQLYHAIAFAGQRGCTIERLRGVIREQRDEIESLTTDPWSPRERIEWDEDDDE